jgi:hypothetical protein
VLTAQGKSNDEIAEELVLSMLTVRTHSQQALTRLSARVRAQLVVIACQNGLVHPDFPSFCAGLSLDSTWSSATIGLWCQDPGFTASSNVSCPGAP